ncbi:MAG: hypothetical protein JKY65_22325 [Planctomycetes bacterium]|nr:hypothetical protein [Planctomycetota bacterium]
MRITLTLSILVLCGSVASAQVANLEREVQKLRNAAAWSQIPWRRCLLKASREALAKNKPLFVYAIAGDPTGRC